MKRPRNKEQRLEGRRGWGSGMSRLLAIAFASVLALVCSAHVGTSDVWFQGQAGSYSVQVVVRMPGVIPGLAQVSVRVEGEGIERVSATPVRWDAGDAGAPPPDIATPVPGDPELYSTELWFMTGGSHSVRVTVEGDRGAGTIMVPVMAVATERLGMQRPLGFVLLGLGIFLFVGALTIVGAAVRESVLPPGEEPNPRHQRRARWAVGISALLFASVLFGGWTWWNSVDEAYAAGIYEPFAASATVEPVGGERVLRFAIADSVWLMRGNEEWLSDNRAPRWTPLIPDHGKLMHMFVVREPGLDAFAHLHPVGRDSSRFDVALPPELPAGRYRVYADVVHESGYAQTLVTDAELPASADDPSSFSNADSAPTADPDDAAWVGGATSVGSIARPTITLTDGSILRWERAPGPLRVDEDAELRFSIRAPDGTPARLEPYMGMRGHAMVTRDDGSVFVHLHPVGSVSMAAQQTFAMREAGDTVAGALGRRLTAADSMAMGHAGMHAPAADAFSFPFAFPEPGRYRVWVQIKRDGRILTGAFDTTVEGG